MNWHVKHAHSIMPNWIQVATIEETPPGSASELVAGDRIVALYNVDGDYYALDGVCPHQGGPLGKGSLEGQIVTCPWHGWQFNVCNGQHQTTESLRHSTFPVKVEEGRVSVDISD